MSHFEHGAIDKITTYLVDPASALKRTLYECPDCKRDVFVRKGKIKIPHFAHRKDKDNSCTYYNRNPSLDQQHKNAQLKLKQFLERRKEIHISRRCACGCGWASNWEIKVSKDEFVKCEYRFKFNESNKSADIAVLTQSMSIGCIFEIVHKHYTREIDRPEPWHEIRADEVNAILSSEETIVLTCVREKIRPECIERQRLEHEERVKLMKQREEERQIIEARYQDWLRKENERIKLRVEKEEEERKKQNDIRQKEMEDKRKKDLEERTKKAEIQKQLEEKIQKETEERQKKEKEYQEKMLEISKQISPCLNCSPFMKWAANVRTWDFCRCYDCKLKIKEKAKLVKN